MILLTSITYETAHIELRNVLLSHQMWRNYTTLTKAKIAFLQDAGVPISDSARKAFFGRSIYNSNGNFDINSANFAWKGENKTPFSMGLHIYGTDN